MLRVTTGCTFSTCQLPKVLRRCCALCVLTWKCASRQNGVHFFDISTSKSGLRPSIFFTLLTSTCASRHKGMQLVISHVTRGSAPAALASLLFDPPEPENYWKNSVLRLFYLFTHLHLLSSDAFSSLTVPTSAFPSLHIAGSLTSKFHSIIQYMIYTIKCYHIILMSVGPRHLRGPEFLRPI